MGVRTIKTQFRTPHKNTNTKNNHSLRTQHQIDIYIIYDLYKMMPFSATPYSAKKSIPL